jgi:hypothetical protein
MAKAKTKGISMCVKAIAIDEDTHRLLTDAAERKGYTLKQWFAALSGIEELRQLEEGKNEIIKNNED